MNLLHRFLLPLAACVAFAGAPAVHADTKIDKEKIANLLDQVRDKLQELKGKEKDKDKDKEGKPPAPAPGGGGTAAAAPKVLALYDAPVGTPFDKLGFAYTIMLRNLLGHFDATVDLMPVQQYTAGKVNSYDATFYMGSSYDFQLPAAFLSDASTTTRTMVWFKYNLWQLAGNPAYNFTATRGIQFVGLRGMNALPTAAAPSPGFFDTVKYKNLDFVKYYNFDSGRNIINADPDIGVTAVADATKASVVVSVANAKTAETAPYITRSGNFWYVADLPFSFIGPRDRYLVFTDVLHDMLGIQHAESHKALVRLEDVGAMVSVQAMKTLSDYLGARKVPFSIAAIPRYVDGLGVYNGGVRQEVNLSQATNLKKSLDYARQRGGEIVMHGFTHQYGTMRNPHTGVSGDDYEFWNIVDNAPFPEDSASWAAGRLYNGLQDLRANGYTPIAWEAPHYHTSAITARTAPTLFTTTYQRVVYFTADKPNFFAPVAKDFGVGQFYPYVIRQDYYGQYVLPENLGNIEYDISTIDSTSNYNYTADDILANARFALAVRDGFASYFFHPFWLEPSLGVPGFEDFKKTVDGITQLGFTWVAPSTLR
ncbi:MAG: papd-like protein [Ramlibacter sp.]|nr:papd-like protein [Ramlibacter sp.]